MLEAAGTAFGNLLQPAPILALLAGTVIGLISGALPATGLPGLVVLIGFAYGMDPYIAIPLAVGMLAPVATTDTIPSVLMGIPGGVGSAATILDGYPMARQGRAGEALGAAYMSSMIGGLFGALVLALSIPVAREVIKLFGAPEFLMMGVVGIMVIAVVSSGALLRGLLSGTLGLLLALVGFEGTYGVERFTFGIQYLYDGISIVPAIIGLFAIPEFLDMVVHDTPIARDKLEAMAGSANRGRAAGIRAAFRHWWLVLRSSTMGVIVGFLPGLGGSVVDWLTYAAARQTEKGASKTFGTGDVRGVIAPESANNADKGGAFIPTLAFGIPGSVSMAIFLGFFVVLGVQPGPAMLNERLDLTFLIVFTLALGNVLATGAALLFTPQMARIAYIKPNILAPILIAVLTLSAFQSGNSLGNLVALMVFSLLGWYMKKYRWARPPVIIALVLGPQLEKYLTLTTGAYSLEQVMARPQMWAILAMAVVVAAYSLNLQRQARTAEVEGEGDPPAGPGPAASAA